MVRFLWKELLRTKTRFTTTHVLSLSECSDSCMINFDASGVGLGCIFMYWGEVITYYSKHLKVHEKNYPTHDLELASKCFHIRFRDISCMEFTLMCSWTIRVYSMYTSRKSWIFFEGDSLSFSRNIIWLCFTIMVRTT